MAGRAWAAHTLAMQTPEPIRRWHEMLAAKDPSGLDELLDDDAVFHSPVVHTPQRGKAVTSLYLKAAFQVLFGEEFLYLRVFDVGDRAVLEFLTELDGIQINGVDMIEWDEEGLITEFKVWVRPKKAMDKLHQLMAAMLEELGPKGEPKAGEDTPERQAS